ncbi:hypothetical protein [Gordonia sp. ABSL49_1]|uniref:Rv3212 family protein n=2 Tax=Gordonia TaxID=2053 RepID=UPI001F1013D6|nr:hypothetical protein [Gordonia sp. ABSL49_1]MCH5645061.1 hypothetical protein [Gordonia sp. ABSL49_1]
MARLRPERRTPIDFVVTAVIVVVVVALGVIAWAVSPVRHTESDAAEKAAPTVPAATAIPDRLVAGWHARSSATRIPALGDAVVVTGDGGDVVAHDPFTGHEVWSYRRDLALCTTDAVWPGSSDSVLAVYRNSRGCSEVTALDGKTGRRTAARSSDADNTLHLVSDSGYVVAQGPTRLETWGSNLVRGIEYGRVDAPVNPDVQPGRANCRLFSSAISGDRVAVIEHCGEEPGYRLTVLGALLNSEEKVTEYGSSLLTIDTLQAPPVLVAMNSSTISIYDAGSTNPGSPTPPRIRLFNQDGVPGSTHDVKGERTPRADSVPIDDDPVVTYWTGQATVVLDAGTGRPKYQVPGTLGPGALMDRQLLLPSPSGISVRDVETGREIRTIALTRTDFRGGTVSLRVIGQVVVEQRGDMIEAFVPAP